jgi:hypothetical protein
VNSNLPFNNLAPFNFNGNTNFTSEVKNIPSGYSVKALSHAINYPIAIGPDLSSSIIFTGQTVPIIFTSISDTFTVSFSVVLEKSGSPDINLSTTFTIYASASIFFGTKSVNNLFNNISLNSTVYSNSNQKLLIPSATSQYVYIVLPTSGIPPLFIRDRNGLVLDMSNFTMTSNSGYDYYILNWLTNIPAHSYWELVYTP